MNWSRQVVAVQGVETQVVLMVLLSPPNLCVSNDLKGDGVPQCHSQAAVLQDQVHTAETRNLQLFNWRQNNTVFSYGGHVEKR